MFKKIGNWIINKIQKSFVENFELLKSKVKYLQYIFIYRMCLDFIYIFFVSRVFNVTGFDFNFNIFHYSLSWLLLIVFLPLILKICYKNNLSNIVFNILIFLSFMPLITMIGYYEFPISFIVQIIIYWYLLLKLFVWIPDFKIKRLSNVHIDRVLLYSIVVILSAVVIFISWYYTGFRLTFDLFDVYNIRAEATEYSIPTILDYLFSATKIINPILLIYFLSKKKYFITFSIFLIQMLSFSINGIKMVLVGTILAIIIYYFYKDSYLEQLPLYLSGLGIVGVVEFLMTNNFSILTLIFRRVLFLPNLINSFYFDFFKSNRPDYFFQGPLRYLGFESIYPKVSNMIGSIYFVKPDMSATNGLFSDAYTNLGLWGIFIMPLLIVVLLKFIDACSRGLDKKIFLPIAVTLSFILMSSFFITILFTHGILLACLVLYLLPRDNETTVPSKLRVK